MSEIQEYMKGTGEVRVFQFNQGIVESKKCGLADRESYVD